MQQCSISKERKMIDRLSKIITTPRGRTKRPSSIPSSIVWSWMYFEYYESHRLTRSIFPTFMENFHKKIIFIPWNETMNISLFTQWIYSFLPSQYSLSPKRRANITSPHILLNIHFLFPSFFFLFHWFCLRSTERNIDGSSDSCPKENVIPVATGIKVTMSFEKHVGTKKKKSPTSILLHNIGSLIHTEFGMR